MAGDLKGFIEIVARALADQPDAVSVKESERRGSTVFELQVASTDLGRVIGRQGRTAAGLMRTCLVGVTFVAALTWLLPGRAAAAAGLVLLGFFLGPIFPTAMAVAPRLTTARSVPALIGIMDAGSVVGGSVFMSGRRKAPWILLAPSAVVVLTTLSISLVGDWLRDRMDPTLQ